MSLRVCVCVYVDLTEKIRRWWIYLKCDGCLLLYTLSESMTEANAND